MTRVSKERLDESNIARHRLFEGGGGPVRRYAELVIGEFSLWRLIRYEAICTFIVPVPGALGLALRRMFCPALFRDVGRNPLFGRNVVLRNAHRITLGDNVVIDDGALLDARGGGDEGIRIGSDVIVHREAIVTSKGGPIRIGDRVDIGSRASLVSQGGLEIGDDVSIAGGCRIGGGLVDSADAEDDEDGSGRSSKVSRRYTRGPVRIADSVTVFQNAIVIDGVEIGQGAIIGAAAFVREDVPAHSTLAPQQRVIVLPHGRQEAVTAAHEDPEPQGAQIPVDRADDVLKAILGAVGELNETRDPELAIPLAPDAELLAGRLDSLDIVNFVAAAEDRLERIGVRLDLASAATNEPSALATVSALRDYVLARAGDHV